MHETERLPFLQRPEFDQWLITSFFMVFAAVVFAFLPVAGAHRLGVAVRDEMSRFERPPAPAIDAPKSAPSRIPLEGVPVAFGAARVGP